MKKRPHAQAHKPTEQERKELAKPLPKRPIMVAGVWMMAFVILAIIILTPSIAGVVGVYHEGAYERSLAFSAAAYYVLLFSVPCVAGIVITTMFNLYIPRKFRLSIASAVYAIMTLFFWIFLAACLVQKNASQAARLLAILFVLTDYVWWLPLVAGAVLGLCLPVTARAHRHARTYAYPRQHRIHVFLTLTTWFFASGGFLYLRFALLENMEYVALTILLPLALFSGTASLFAYLGRRETQSHVLVMLSKKKFARSDALVAYVILLIAGFLFSGVLLCFSWAGSIFFGIAFGLAVAVMQR